MKLQFDKNQQHQLDAIQSVVDLFDGQLLRNTEFEVSAIPISGNREITLLHASNELLLSENILLDNLVRVQRRNNLAKAEISNSLQKLEYHEDDDKTTITTAFPNYSVEMETGTGKTYVYLRSIYELNKTYGFKKFVIVVPGVAIRESVIKSLEITFDHFQEIYDNQPAEHRVYDSRYLSSLARFAESDAIQILVINIDSFTKDANIINQWRESGVKPIEHIQNAQPIVIIDEPQNMETEIRKRAIARLNPLLTLRFSATHKNLYNLVYKLDPVTAYELGLVKQIEVDSVIAKNESSNVFLSINSFKVSGKGVSVSLSSYVNEKSEVKRKNQNVKVGDDLYDLSGNVEMYRDGYIVQELDSKKRSIRFSNGKELSQNTGHTGLADEVLKTMIDVTVENHFKKLKQMQGMGIKVLSLFFIDRVANYRVYKAGGMIGQGKFAKWFEASYKKWQAKPGFLGLLDFKAREVHDGYFSRDRAGKYKDSRETRINKADDETFNLIMRDKERLLNEEVPLQFIFTHSALREGWDNPNVFQICTLNETRSDIKKRQEIGRGLRLCVDQTGARNTDREINRLTVIANEAYESFSKSLQKEIEKDCGVKFEGRIKNARERTRIALKDKWNEDPDFLDIWERISAQTAYTVTYNSQKLISRCVKAIQKMPLIAKPEISRETTQARFMRNADQVFSGIEGENQTQSAITVNNLHYDIPDFITYIGAKTNLTRTTITEILLSSGRIKEVFNNPGIFMDAITNIVNHELSRIQISGIKYERIPDNNYDLKIFESTENEHYSDSLIKVINQSKTLWDYIPFHSINTAEHDFLNACDRSDDVVFYMKLPEGFSVNTPFGLHNPGWAVIMKGKADERSYFVIDIQKARASKKHSSTPEKVEIITQCVKKSFEVISHVKHLNIQTFNDLYKSVSLPTKSI